ncbi:hypothetical protein [uncultured Dokdonia sp.]|uniref:hypothetical protein n=1 Tax=uncultured Dokdonia sp. TaxID=575653 RepID=UPI00263346A5|nr:hypothetical protein [uncultured Dokdonia sp.]
MIKIFVDYLASSKVLFIEIEENKVPNLCPAKKSIETFKALKRGKIKYKEYAGNPKLFKIDPVYKTRDSYIKNTIT